MPRGKRRTASSVVSGQAVTPDGMPLSARFAGSTSEGGSGGGVDNDPWTAVAYNAGDFTADGSMTWTVDAGDVAAFRYKLLGTTMFVNLVLVGTVVGGTASATLRIKIPGGKLGAVVAEAGITVVQNAGSNTNGDCYVTAGGNQMNFRPSPATPNWTLGALTLYASLQFEVQP